MLPWKKILCPTDFSEPSYAALHAAHDLATGFGSELCVLHVMEEMTPVLGLVSVEEFDRLRSDEAAQRIHQVVREQLGEEVQVRAIVRSGMAASEILHAAEVEKPDVIVIATHGLTGWRRLVFGSVAEAVGRLATCPVLIIHEQEGGGSSSGQTPGRSDEASVGKVQPESAALPEEAKGAATTDSATTDSASPLPRQLNENGGYEPCLIDEAQFPVLGEKQDKLRFFLNYAVLAPSSHNAQPWLWKFDGDVLELHADYSRSLPTSDPFDRELIIGCGAALFNLRIAIRRFGFCDEVELFPSLGSPSLLARIALGECRQTNDAEHLLFAAIPLRHTHRLAFEDRDLPGGFLKQLQAAAAAEGGILHFIGSDRLASLVEEGNLTREFDGAFLRELREWVIYDSSAGTTGRADGIPLEALGTSGMATQATSNRVPLPPHLPLSSPESGSGVQNPDEQNPDGDLTLMGNSSVVAVLGTDSDTPRSWLATGQALEHVLLWARANGIYASYFNQPVQVQKLWTQLRRVVDPQPNPSFYPQMVFRLGSVGRATEIVPTPRRPVDAVLVEDLGPNPTLATFAPTYR